jgi:hypothetical protein
MIEKNKKQNRYNSGQAMLLSVIFLLFISMTVILGIATPILKQIRISQDIIRSKESYFLAEGSIEDVLYRLRTGKQVGASETFSTTTGSVTITVSNTATGKQVTTSADTNSKVRNMQTNVTLGTGVSFHYGIQVGTGGLVMSNNSTVTGNVYSNGSIVGASGVVITGSAVAANSSSLYADQSNGTTTPPVASVTFGQNSSNEDLAQEFQVSTDGPINKISVYIKKTSTPGNLTVRILPDNSGSPGTNTIAQGTLSASSVSSSYGWVDVSLSSNPSLNSSVNYWLVLDLSLIHI